MRSTFLSDDVEILLTDVTNKIQAKPIEIREKLISSGKKACDTIPMENIPTKEEILVYDKALEISAIDTALAVKCLAEKIYERKGKDVVLVSLIRGGICAGILIKRYLENKYKIKVPHFAITLVATKGIDEKAIEYILSKYDSSRIQFIDGWTGKGAVSRMLNKSVRKYIGVSSELAVLSDPGNLTELAGTHDDILIPSACLNSLLAGLVSRAVPLEDSFFGAIFFEELKEYDRTYHFINSVEAKLELLSEHEYIIDNSYTGLKEIEEIAHTFNISDIHFIKPGMGETVRAFIRKKPDIILVKNEVNKYTDFIKEIVGKNNVLIKEYPLKCYNSCGIYKDTNSDVL